MLIVLEPRIRGNKVVDVAKQLGFPDYHIVNAIGILWRYLNSLGVFWSNSEHLAPFIRLLLV